MNSSHISESPKAQRPNKSRADPPERHSPLTLPSRNSPQQLGANRELMDMLNRRPRNDTGERLREPSPVMRPPSPPKQILQEPKSRPQEVNIFSKFL